MVLDHFVTDTARFADCVFPAATQAEYLDLLAPWGSPYLTLNLPAVEPVGEPTLRFPRTTHGGRRG